MNTGMLWFDNDPKTTLKAKVIRAADYYRKKYGVVPNLCLIHPGALEVHGAMEADSISNLGKLTVRPYRAVLPGHLWIGIEDRN